MHCKHTYNFIGTLLWRLLVVYINISLLFQQTCSDKKINTQNSTVEILPKFRVSTPRVCTIVDTKMFRTECFCSYKTRPLYPWQKLWDAHFFYCQTATFFFIFFLSYFCDIAQRRRKHVLHKSHFIDSYLISYIFQYLCANE